MEFTDLQMTLTVVVVLTAAAALVWFDYLRKQRQPQQLQRIKLVKTPPLPAQRSKKIFDPTPLDYAPAKKLAAERSQEPLVGIATASRPPVQRENVKPHRRNGAALSFGAILLDGSAKLHRPTMRGATPRRLISALYD